MHAFPRRSSCVFEPSRVDSFFDFRHGLLLNTTLPDGHCNLESDAIAAARLLLISLPPRRSNALRARHNA